LDIPGKSPDFNNAGKYRKIHGQKRDLNLKVVKDAVIETRKVKEVINAELCLFSVTKVQ